MSTRLLVGTYEESGSLWELELDPEAKQVLKKACVSPTRRNSYLVKNGGYVFAVSEIPLAEGGTGSLHSFRVTGTGLEKVDTLEHLPPLLPHLWVNRAGTVVYTASYGTGEIMAIRVKNGKFGEILSYTRSSGSSVNPRRQTCAHPHSVWLDAQEKFLYLCDLGTDEILRWPLGETGALITEKRQSLSVPGGYGPRHLVLSPDGKKAWVLTEMIWHLLEVDISGETMVLTRDISLAADIPAEAHSGGAIRLSSDGRRLFCTNRGNGHSRIDILALPHMEKLQTLTECRCPRDILLTEDGCYLICGNQTEHSLSIFRRDETGSWTLHWTIPEVPTPVCILKI